MKKKTLLLVLASSLSMSACSFTNKSSSSDGTVNISSDRNYDNDASSNIISGDSENDFDDVEIPEENVETPDEYDSFSDGTIANAGKYYLKGEYSSISITASKNSELYIFLDGVSINCTTGIAFGSSKAIKLHLVILNNSTNTIVNDYLDENAFHVKGDVYLSGTGTLNVESKQKNGFKVSKDLYIYNGVTLNAKGYGHAITARSVTADSCAISAISQTKDGIQTECDDDVVSFTKEQGFIYLSHVTYTADTYGDGMQADTYVYISGGQYNITTHGEFVAYSSSALSEYGLSSDDFKYVKSGNTYKRVAKDEIHGLSSSYYALKNSVKGIKAGAIEYDSNDDGEDDTTVTNGEYQVFIAHLANLNINSTDDCIHTNYGSTTIDSANLELETFDDGIHADYDLLVNNASIGITNSYEGLEGGNVTINGENTNIISNSQDDGINAASDLVSTNSININEGYLRVFASGDGLDANTALYLNGGTVIVEGPGHGNGSLDAEQIYFNGGVVMACSTSGMTERMSATQYTFVWQGTTINSGVKVSVIDDANNALFSYTLKQSGNQIIFSHPDMQANQTYRLVSESTVVASITMSSTLVTSGTSQGGPGGGGPGGGPGR